MRQVTGSNLSRPANKVSIRLGSDGHSFSVVGAETLRGGAAGVTGTAWVEVEVLTPLTLLVPAALCDGRNGAALLAAAGLSHRAGGASKTGAGLAFPVSPSYLCSPEIYKNRL